MVDNNLCLAGRFSVSFSKIWHYFFCVLFSFQFLSSVAWVAFKFSLVYFILAASGNDPRTFFVSYLHYYVKTTTWTDLFYIINGIYCFKNCIESYSLCHQHWSFATAFLILTYQSDASCLWQSTSNFKKTKRNFDDAPSNMWTVVSHSIIQLLLLHQRNCKH